MANEEFKSVCCRNVNIITKYVTKNLGNADLLFENLPHEVSFYQDENNWITLSEFVAIMNRAIDILKDPEAPFNMGLSAQELESWGAFKYLQKVFASVIMGPVEVYKQVGKYNTYFNKTKDLVVVGADKDHCYVKIKFKNDIDPIDDFLSDSFIRGILTSVPKIWNLPEARILEPRFEYDLERLLLMIGQIQPSELRFVAGRCILRNEEIAHQVVLLSEKVEDEYLYLGDYREVSGDENWDDVKLGFLVTKDVQVNPKLKLSAGSVFNAPYFIYKITWKPLNLIEKIYQAMLNWFLSKRAYREGLESQLETIKNYVETLEDKVVQRTEQLNIAKEESEYWRGRAEGLLQTILPENVVTSMMQGKLKAEEIEGTIVFTDLVGFTSFSKDVSPEEVSKQLTGYFTEMSHIINKNYGWVNKFLGDGILALFGLQTDQNHTECAIKAALEMQRVMEKYPWQKRIGIATGKFITGEFGTQKTRRFDCLGHVVNLASRLQSHAEPGEVLVCENTYGRMKERFVFGPKKQITPKGVGVIEVYSLSPKDNI